MTKILYIYPGMVELSPKLSIIESEKAAYNIRIRERKIVKYTRNLGYQCDLYMPTRYQDDWRLEGDPGAWFYPVDNIGFGSNKNYTSTILLKRIEDEKPDMVVFKGADLNISRWLIIKSKHYFKFAVIIGGKHSDLITSYADYILAETESQVKYYRTIFRKSKKVSLLPKLLIPEDFKLNSDKQFDIVNVGRFTPKKNQKLLVELFKEYSLALIGDGETYKEIKGIVQSEDIDAYMPGLIPHEQISSIVSKSKIMVHPSSAEGLPRVIIEAFACKVPVVVLRKIIPDGFIHGIHGLMVEEDDLQDEVESLLADENRLRDMGQRAYEYAREGYSEAAVLAVIEVMYTRMLNNPVSNHEHRKRLFIIKIRSVWDAFVTMIYRVGKKLGLVTLKRVLIRSTKAKYYIKKKKL